MGVINAKMRKKLVERMFYGNIPFFYHNFKAKEKSKNVQDSF